MKKDQRANVKPLAGRRVVNTRPRDTSTAFSDKLRALGADVIEVPAIRIEALDDGPIRKALRQINTYDLLVFSSANAVDIFMDCARKLDVKPAAIQNLKIAVIGPATQEALAAAALRPDIVADDFVAERLLHAIEKYFSDLHGKRILFPKALKTRDVIKNGLEKRGGIVDDIPIYQTVCAEPSRLGERLRDLQVPPDVIAFTSSSAAEGFRQLVPEGILQAILENSVIACIGPVTARTAESVGFRVRIIAEAHTTDGLAESIASYFENDDSASTESRR